jgi:hypothetical protein
MARRISQEGIVVLQVVIGADGRPLSVDALDGPQVFRDTAAAFARACQYKPAQVGGAPVTASVLAMIPMRLQQWLYWGETDIDTIPRRTPAVAGTTAGMVFNGAPIYIVKSE